jgi:hypothetical protein
VNWQSAGRNFPRHAPVFIVNTTLAGFDCRFGFYGQWLDVNGDGKLDFMCAREGAFAFYDVSTLPFRDVSHRVPAIADGVDTAIADFDGDGRDDIFVVQGRDSLSGAVQVGGKSVEAALMGGDKSFRFVSEGAVTFELYWSKLQREGKAWLDNIRIGASGRRPTAIPFTLDPRDPSVAGMPSSSATPAIHIGVDPRTHRWTVRHPTGDEWSNTYFVVSSTSWVWGVESTGLWPLDRPVAPLLLLNRGTRYENRASAAGLSEPIPCISAVAEDFDNDGDVDLYLACSNAVTNLPNILYENRGNGTFVKVSGAGGARGGWGREGSARGPGRCACPRSRSGRTPGRA